GVAHGRAELGMLKVELMVEFRAELGMLKVGLS
ncbi:hypothetical protein A2U01_0057339, partial [Trifolium medium]|nr:hypothetical protein [Trifolium medium]